MLTREQNTTLTGVGPGTQMGNLMRCYWVPALLSWEIMEPDCPPVEVRLLGEDLVAFRDTEGKVGLVSAYCAHRRANLFWGRNEECGLRCVYHGWKFDLEGNCVDMPSEPDASSFKDKVRIPAYPTFEAGGLVWAYMGPSEKPPAAPLFEWTQVAPAQRSMSKVWQECNWLQALEGGIDSVHSNFLHGGRPPGLKYEDTSPRGRAQNYSTAALLEVVPTDYGYTYGSMRPMGEQGNFVRGYHWVMPWTQIRALNATSIAGHMWVPVDDHNTMVYNWHYYFGEDSGEHEEQLPESEPPIWLRDAHRPMAAGNGFGVDVDVENGFRSVRNQGNRYMIDREVQKTQTYTGIAGTNTQDRAVQESMGRVADRTLERLGTTDRAVIAARRELLRAVKTVEDGGNPPGVAPTFYKLRAVERIVPPDADWFEIMAPALFQMEAPTPTVS